MLVSEKRMQRNLNERHVSTVIVFDIFVLPADVRLSGMIWIDNA